MRKASNALLAVRYLRETKRMRIHYEATLRSLAVVVESHSTFHDGRRRLLP